MKTKPPKNPRLETPFALAIKANIKKAIRAFKKEGTVAVGADTLKAYSVPRGNDMFLPGSFSGTNAPYHYAELFREIVADMPEVKPFIIA